MKKLLSVLMVASMVSFVACKGGKKEETVDSTKIKDSIANAEKAAAETATPTDTATMTSDTTKKEEGKKEEGKKDEAKHEDHK